MKLRLTQSPTSRRPGWPKTFFGETAVAAGWIDEIVLPDMVLSRAEEAAREFATLNSTPTSARSCGPGRCGWPPFRAGIDNMAAEFEV